MSYRIRVFLVDDHAVLRAGLKLLLDAEPDMSVTGEAGDTAQAVALIQEANPDVVLLDISMPNSSGLDALAMLKEKSPHSRFLILTMHDDESYLRKALSLGASGYVLKQGANNDLLSAIRVVHHDGTYLHHPHRHLLFENAKNTPVVETGTDEMELIHLSPREQEIMVLIASGYTNRQAAEKLFLSEKTIETYKSRLMSKLKLHSRIELVRYALQHGLIKT